MIMFSTLRVLCAFYRLKPLLKVVKKIASNTAFIQKG